MKSKRKQRKAKASVGRPTVYKAEFCDKVLTDQQVRACGASDVSIAAALGVSRMTVNRWRGEHPAFAEACAQAKEVADDLVEVSMFQRARGYSHEAVKIFQNEGQPIYARYTEHYPPDTGAAMNWLKNRRPHLWRDRVEHTGADGGPIVIAAALEEARRRAAVDVPFEEVKQIASQPAEEAPAGADTGKPSVAAALKAKRAQ